MAVTCVKMWGRFKEMQNTIEQALIQKQGEALQDLDLVLRKHRPDFTSLLKNPARNPTHLELVRKANLEGLQVQGQQARQLLSESFIEETIIISELFQLNELLAVDLLISAENQLPYFPGLSRGLLAVLLYYDGRASLVGSLRTMLQARNGTTWTFGLPNEAGAALMQFTDQLLADGLIQKIMNLLKALDWVKEVDKLNHYKGLGEAKHRYQVHAKFEEIRSCLAECVFCCCCQTFLNGSDVMILLSFLKELDVNSVDESIDGVSLTLLLSMLYSIDLSILDQDSSEEMLEKLPLLHERDLMNQVHSQLLTGVVWKSPPFKSVIQMAWGLSLALLSKFPFIQGVSEICEHDEEMLQDAIEHNVLDFLNEKIVSSKTFHQEEFYVRRIHSLVVNFLVQSPLKVKELRNKGDEEARIVQAHLMENVVPPVHLRHDFHHLLLLIASLYEQDPLNLNLAVDFWCPADSSQSTSKLKAPDRQIALSKFVGQAGDLLPAALYVPYVKMLTGLACSPQAAQQCFNFLCINSHPSSGRSSQVSWDHIFSSLHQYYNSLQRETTATAVSGRLISPAELDALLAVLKLMEQIAQQSEMARIMMFENRQWLPTIVCLGLVRCAVSWRLKAQLLHTLAAFTKSEEIVMTLWQAVETAQIIQTYSTPQGSSVGLQIELDEVESCNEDFSITLGFLALLDGLTNYPVPGNLGAGYRAPGFSPYLDYIINSVLLKFYTRAYKIPAQKWKVCEGVVKILVKLLDVYKPSSEDMNDRQVELQSGSIVKANKRPGYKIMSQLLKQTQLLSIILQVIHDVIRILLKFIDLPGKNEAENAALRCLELLNAAFEKQDFFLQLVRESGSSLLVTPLDSLLLAINPSSSQPDHLLNVARYICMSTSLPKHGLAAIKILLSAAHSSRSQGEMLQVFLADKVVSLDLLRGFVESLEASANEEEKESCELQQLIIKLLLHTLSHQAPNLAHFMLGFDIRSPVSQTRIQDPGVLSSPRTCLHAITLMISRTIGTHQSAPHLTSQALQLLYSLCAGSDTSEPTLRYLRSSHDLIYSLIQHLPFTEENDEETYEFVQQQAWLLKTAAIELKLTASNQQRSHVQRLVSLLLDDAPNETQGPVIGDLTIPYEFESLSRLNASLNVPSEMHSVQYQRRILRILDGLSFKHTMPNMPRLEFFESALIEQVIQSCEQPGEGGTVQCNIIALHGVLAEVNSMQNSGPVGQKALIFKEIQAICESVVERNRALRAIATKQQVFDGWRQLLAILLNVCPSEVLLGEQRLNFILQVLQHLLRKLADDDNRPDLTSPAAGVLLSLMVHLQYHFCEQVAPSAQQPASHCQFSWLLDESAPAMIKLSPNKIMFSSALQIVLRGLLDHMMSISSSSQQERANLYGSLLYLLRISKPSHCDQEIVDAGDRPCADGDDADNERLMTENLATINTYGRNFQEQLCRDACGGHDVCRMLALSVLNLLLCMERDQLWQSFLSSHGYLEHMVDSLSDDDKALQDILTYQDTSLNILYVYQSKMSLLTRVAESVAGAENLLQCAIPTRLACCIMFDMRPSSSGEAGDISSFLPSLMERYRQLLNPVLKLFLSILSSFGSKNRRAKSMILQFLVAHVDIVLLILQDRQSNYELASLQELALLTAVVSRAAAYDLENDAVIGEMIQKKQEILRIQRQMMALMPRYCLNEKLLSQLKMKESPELNATLLAIEQIAANITSFCRTLVTASGDAGDMVIVLTPSLIEAAGKDSIVTGTTSASPSARLLGLGVLVIMMKQGSLHFINVSEQWKQTSSRLENLSNLTGDELQELCGQKKEESARQVLSLSLAQLSRQLRLLTFIIENCLLILWRHLDFYFNKCCAPQETQSLIKISKQKGMRSLLKTPEPYYTLSPSQSSFSDFSSQISSKELHQLSEDALSILSDSFFKQLLHIEQSYNKSRTRYGFIQAIVRKIQRMIQHSAVM